MVGQKRPALTGVLETCLYVAEIARSRKFYEDVFGFVVLTGDDRICAFDVAPGNVLILFRRGGTQRPIPVGGGFIPPHDGGGEQHFALAVPDDAFAHWKVYLERLDIEVESEIAWPQGGRSVYFRDPDRLVIELATPGLWANY